MAQLDLSRRGRREAPQVVGVVGAVAGWAPPRPGATQARTWLAAQPSRLLADLPGAVAPSFNRDLRQALPYLRNRSRWLAQNDGYTRGYLALLRRNVVGPSGFSLQMAVRSDRGDAPDADANARIEAAWDEWCGACEVTGKLTFSDLTRQTIIGVARDGEALFRKIRMPGFNRHGFALQVLDPAMLDEAVNGRPQDGAAGVADGNVVRSGVEIDAWGRPAAYWLRSAVPHDDPMQPSARRLVRVPAGEMLHLFVPEWPHQVRGVPWLSASLRTLAMLDGYSEAELTAARVAAGKMGFYKQADPEDIDAALAEDGKLVQEAEAGTFELLPKGVEFETYDPQHPNAAFKDFVAAQQRQAAAGANVSYAAFANDPGSLNYSGLRHVALEDRDEYRTLQDWMIGAFPMRFFGEWLTDTLLAGVTGLPPAKAFKFNAPRFRPRGWQWVDPQNEIAAIKEEIALGLNSRTKAAAERGEDLEDIVSNLRREQEMMSGITPPPGAAGAVPAKP